MQHSSFSGVHLMLLQISDILLRTSASPPGSVLEVLMCEIMYLCMVVAILMPTSIN